MAAGPNNGDAYMIANAAMAQLESHEKVCEWRYQQIVMNQNLGAQDRVTMHAENKAALEKIGGRIDRMYSRAWVAMITIMGLLGGGLMYFIKSYLEAHP